MNILILNWRDPRNPLSGGAEFVTMEHAKAWVKAKNSVTWFTSRFPLSKEKEKIGKIEVIRRGSQFSVHIYAFLFYIFSGKKFDIIIDEIHGIPFFTPLYIHKPIVAFIHEVAGDIWTVMYPFPISIIGQLFERFYFVLYSTIPFWTVSYSTQQELVKMGIVKKNITIVYNGIDAVHRSGVKKEAKPTFIFVSRLVRMKGIEKVIEAFRHIVKSEPTAQLWIVGEGKVDYVNKLKNSTEDISASVRFFGKVSDNEKFTLMKKAHILLHASVKEGWGMVVIEAASQDTPAIVYNTGGLKDSVLGNKTGIILKTNSPSEMAREALILFHNKKKYSIFQKHCGEWVRSLSWTKSKQKSKQLLQDIYRQYI